MVLDVRLDCNPMPIFWLDATPPKELIQPFLFFNARSLSSLSP